MNDQFKIALVRSRSISDTTLGASRYPYELASLGAPFSDHRSTGNYRALFKGHYGIEHPTAKVQIFDARLHPEDSQEFLQEIGRFKPDVVGVTATTIAIGNAKRLAERIRGELGEKPKFILGGVHITSEPESFEKPFDLAVRGRGNEPLALLISHLQDPQSFPLESVPGLVYSDNGSLKIKEPNLTRNVPFENLPPVRAFFQLGLVDIKRYSDYYNGLFPGTNLGKLGLLFFSEGCPFRCRFCANPYTGKKPAYRSPSDIVADIKYLYEEQGIKTFYAYDELLTSKPELVKEFLRLMSEAGLSRGNGINFISCTRGDKKLLETVDSMKGSIISGMGIAPETCNNYLNNAVLKKGGLEMAEVVESTRRLEGNGIKTEAFLMIGVPEQKWSDINAILDYIRVARPTGISVSTLMPMPGSPLYSEMKGISPSKLPIFEDMFAKPSDAELADGADYSYAIPTEEMSAVEINLAGNMILAYHHALSGDQRSAKHFNQLIKRAEERGFFSRNLANRFEWLSQKNHHQKR